MCDFKITKSTITDIEDFLKKDLNKIIYYKKNPEKVIITTKNKFNNLDLEALSLENYSSLNNKFDNNLNLLLNESSEANINNN